MKTYVYILRCADGSLYTGWTTDITRRLKEHNGEHPGGRGAKCTHARRPCELVYRECFENDNPKEAKRAAMKREYAIKKLSRAEKLGLISET